MQTFKFNNNNNNKLHQFYLFIFRGLRSLFISFEIKESFKTAGEQNAVLNSNRHAVLFSLK